MSCRWKVIHEQIELEKDLINDMLLDIYVSIENDMMSVRKWFSLLCMFECNSVWLMNVNKIHYSILHWQPL